MVVLVEEGAGTDAVGVEAPEDATIDRLIEQASMSMAAIVLTLISTL
jgi:hypothetical protein